jgi:septum formation protein
LFNKLGKIILASSSPRRLKLLRNLGLKKIQVIKPSINEKNFLEKNALKKSVRNIAMQKALYVRQMFKNPNDSTIIAGDTLVFRAGRILHKAESKEVVKSYLNYLSSRKHKVYGGICIISKEGKIFSKVVVTEIIFERLEHIDLSEKLLDEGVGKAGGYAIQGTASKFIRKIKGSYTNVVGLSIPEVYKIFKII